MNILMLASGYRMPYRVMRAAGLAGGTVYVLGTERASGLAKSLHCKSFIVSQFPFLDENAETAINAINRLCAELSVDLVMPSDPQTSRFLISVRSRLTAPAFPAPDLATFDLLNDKWLFTKIMGELGASRPSTRRFENVDALRREWELGNIAMPSIAKPLSESGGAGVFKLTLDDAASQIAKIDYRPIIVQDFITGTDVDATAYCEAGEIRAFVVYRRSRGVYYFFNNAKIYEDASKLARHLSLEGIMNFDLVVVNDSAEIHWIECNPRVFYTIDVLAIAGMNFAALGMGTWALNGRSAISQASLKKPNALLASLLKPWTITKKDWEYLWFLLSDPVAYFRETLRLERV